MPDCCEDCKLEKENPAKYNLVMQYRNHLSHEEMHDRLSRKSGSNSGYHREMLDWHKNERIKVQAEIRKLG